MLNYFQRSILRNFINVISGHRDTTSEYDEQNRIYMHKIDTQATTTPRFDSGEAYGDRAQQVSQNHISREYEDYSNNGNKIVKGKSQ